MTDVIALQNFDHNGDRKKNSKFPVSLPVAKALAGKGLVHIVQSAGKKKPAPGAKSSASPAAPVSTKKTAKKSDNGDKEDQTGALL